MKPVRLVIPVGAVAALLLLSARDGGQPAATETPAPTTSPMTSVPVQSPVETTTTGVSPTPPTSSPGTSGEGGPVSTTTLPAPPSWPVIDTDPLGCVDAWGRWSRVWCDPRVLQVCVPGNQPNTLDCRLTPAGEQAAAEEGGDELPETAMGSRWA